MAFNGSDFFAWMTCAAKALGTNEKLINDLNVFPVPDGDTGSNMRGTVADALAGTQPSVHFGQCAKTVSDKMLKSARGNSGTILSQYFCGFSSRLAGSGTVDFSDISDAMAMGTKQAYSAVSVPREGTVLSVMRAAGEYAAELCPNFEGSGPEFFDKICTEAEKALLLTKETLPILKEADVVDSGGLGFLTVLRGFVSAFSDSSDSGLFSSEITSMPKADFSAYSTESFTFSFCTECIVSKSADFLGSDKCKELKALAETLGDSLVFVETDELIKLHVHTNSPAEVFSAAALYGTLEQTKAEDMSRQHTELISDGEEAAAAPCKTNGFVFVCAGEGFENIFRDLGADNIVFGGQTMNPSAGEIAAAIALTNAENVFVFPGNKNICLTAIQAQKLTGQKNVIVIPTESLPESISAALNFDNESSPEDNCEAMTAAAKAITTVSVTKAVRNASVNGTSVSEGQYIGICGGNIAAAANSPEDCLEAMSSIFEAAEFVNIYYGAEVSAQMAKETAGLISSLAPDGEVELIPGGQPLYDYLISLE